jgi:glutathione S-transferase
MAIKVLGLAHATCTLRITAVANALNIPLEIEPVDLSKGAHKSPEYIAKYQPFGRIPVLVEDDFILYESRAICRYLINKYQTKDTVQLIPTDLKQAALVEQYISVETSEYNGAVAKYVAEVVFKPMMGRGVTDPEVAAKAREEIIAVLSIYDKFLEGKTYLVGDSFTLADICHLPYGHYAYQAGLADVFDSPERPNVARWWKAISNQDAWKAAVAK